MQSHLQAVPYIYSPNTGSPIYRKSHLVIVILTYMNYRQYQLQAVPITVSTNYRQYQLQAVPITGSHIYR